MDAPETLEPPPPIVLRRASEMDADAVAELSGQLGYPIPAEAVRKRLARFVLDPDHVVLVAETGGRVCGWVHAHVQQSIELAEPRGEIMGLVVAENVRRAGIGRLLMAQAEQWARERGLDLMVLRSNVQRPESHAFYPAVGYEHFKTQAAYRKRLR